MRPGSLAGEESCTQGPWDRPQSEDALPGAEWLSSVEAEPGEEPGRFAKVLTELARVSAPSAGFLDGQGILATSTGDAESLAEIGRSAPAAGTTEVAAQTAEQFIAILAAHAAPTGPVLLRKHRPFQGPQPRFFTLQQWEGHVEQRTDDSFIARLVDLSDPYVPEEEAEVLLSEVSEDDLDLVVPGAVFYWTIGYRDPPSGRERVSCIRLRRLPTVTEQDVHRATEEAKRISERLGWH